VIPILFLLAFAGDESAKLLPDGAGKAAVAKVCVDCHDTEPFRRLRLSRGEWANKIDDMVRRGAKGKDPDFMAVLDYLSANFGKESKIQVNTAPFGEVKDVLGLTNEEAEAILAYRKRNGGFREWRDLLKIDKVDAKKIEAKKDLMAF
jgi:competence protein ComEA